jgi:hypothetical protein
MTRNRTYRPALLLAGLAWVVAVSGGFLCLLMYKTAPCDAGTPASHWPVASQVRPVADKANLVVLAHPRCPCSVATIGELARLMALHQDRVAAHVLFCRPSGFPPGWEQTDLWNSAATIPGVRVLTDDEGTEARRFGATTSGHVLLYDASGTLLFSGGITSARGHAGDNAGLAGIAALLTDEQAERTRTPVFGCPIHDPCTPGGRDCQTCKP